VAGIDAMSPIAQDIVVTGHDRDEIGFLIFPNIPECRRLPASWRPGRRHHRPARCSTPRSAAGCAQGMARHDQARRRLLHLSDARHPDGRAAVGRGMARSPTRATSTSARCSRVAPTWSEFLYADVLDKTVITVHPAA
jgi:feruloyl-CoA synthase